MQGGLNLENKESTVTATDRVTPAILGLLFLMGGGLLGTIAFGSLQIHFYDYSTEEKEAQVAGYVTGGANITFEQNDQFIQEMRESNYYMIVGGLGGLAAIGMMTSALLFLNRRHPAAHVGIVANILAIIQALWASSIGTEVADGYAPQIGNTYYLLGMFHSVASLCCLIMASSIVLTAAGRASLMDWNEPNLEAYPELQKIREITEEE